MKRIWSIIPVLAVVLTACQGAFPWESQEGNDARGAVTAPTTAPTSGPDLMATIQALQQSAAQPMAPTQGVIQPIPGDLDGQGCDDKLYTYPANTANTLYDFEVQSEVVQMNDFYTPGNPTIIVLERAIAPQERSAYALGWGSAWGIFTDRPGCENFDIVANAVSYAESRLDQGHAGLVVDFRDGETALVVAKLETLSEAEAQRLWDMYREAGHDSGRTLPQDATNASDMIFLTPPSPEALAAAGVCRAQADRAVGTSTVNGREVVVMGPWTDWTNIQIWFGNASNSPDPGNHMNFLVPPNWTYVFDVRQTDLKGGGRWNYAGCTYEQLVTDLEWSGLPTWHIDENGDWAQGPIPEPSSDALVTIAVPPGLPVASPTPTP